MCLAGFLDGNQKTSNEAIKCQMDWNWENEYEKNSQIVSIAELLICPHYGYQLLVTLISTDINYFVIVITMRGDCDQAQCCPR